MMNLWKPISKVNIDGEYIFCKIGIWKVGDI